jgi:hypothetical protein
MELLTLLYIGLAFVILYLLATIVGKFVRFTLGAALIALLVFSALFFVQHDKLPGVSDITGAVTSIDAVNDSLHDVKDYAEDKSKELKNKSEQEIKDVMKKITNSSSDAPTITIS